MNDSQPYVLATGAAGAERLRLLQRLAGPGTLRALQASGLAAGMSAVDIGCGIGTVTRQIAERVGDTGRVTGVDASAAQIEVARRECQELARVAFTVASAYCTNLPSASYDFVYCRFLLCHLERPADAIAEMGRLLRPRGILLCEDQEGSTLTSVPPTEAYTNAARRSLALGHKRGVNLGPGGVARYEKGRSLMSNESVVAGLARLGVLTALLGMLSGATAAVIETGGTRHDIGLPASSTGEVSHVFSQPPVPGVPPLTEVTIFNDGRCRSQSPPGADPPYEVRGHSFATSSKLRSDGVYVFTGYGAPLDSGAGWAGGTGPYANPTGFGVFAGFGWATSSTTNAYTATDIAYLVAPDVTSTAYAFGDISDGKPNDTSRLTNVALAFYDVSRRITGVPVPNDDGPQVTPLAVTLPFALTQETVNFDGPDDLTGTFRWTGPGSNFVEGTWSVGNEFCMACLFPAVGAVPLPGTVPFQSGAQRVFLTGYQDITGGAGDGYIVTGGRIGFVALERLDDPAAPTGLLDMTTYGWIEVQAIPEPKTTALMVGGLAAMLLFARSRFRRS